MENLFKRKLLMSKTKPNFKTIKGKYITEKELESTLIN